MEAKVAKTLMEAYASVYDRPEGEIIEQCRVGFRPDGRYQNADCSHTGPIMGAIKSILSGNLPKSRTVIPPTPQQRNRSPFDKTSGGSITVTQTRNPTKKTPYSKGEDGKLTDFGAGGGDEKMRRTGMSVAEVEKLGRKNLGKKSPGAPPGMRERMGEDVDVFDVVKGYLMTEHDLTEEQALKVMLEFEDEQIDESIVPNIDDKLKGRSRPEGPRIKMGPGEGGRRPKKDRHFDKIKDMMKREDVDVFDVVKGYLMTEHDLTEEQAMKVMLELEDEHRDAIIENVVRTGNINLPSMKGRPPTVPGRRPLPTLGSLDLDKLGRQAAERLGGEIGARRGRNTGGNVLGIPEKIGRQRGTSVGRDTYDKIRSGNPGGAIRSVLDALK